MKNEEKIIVEIALIKYTKKGQYDYTLNSEYKNFENEEQARNFIKNNIEKDYEFYLYHSKEDLEDSQHFDVVISNDILKIIDDILDLLIDKWGDLEDNNKKQFENSLDLYAHDYLEYYLESNNIYLTQKEKYELVEIIKEEFNKY